LASALDERKQSLAALEALIARQSNKKQVDSEALTKICEQLNLLRENNLGFSETLLHLYRESS
jgi:hypothetical protein